LQPRKNRRKCDVQKHRLITGIAMIMIVAILASCGGPDQKRLSSIIKARHYMIKENM